MRKKVLIVDENASRHRRTIREFPEDEIEFFLAHSIEEAECLFSEHADFSLIILDAPRVNNQPISEILEFLRDVRECFPAEVLPILAVAERIENNEALVAAGCSHRTLDKHYIPEYIEEILGVKRKQLADTSVH